MAKTNEENLLAVLEAWPKENLISVPDAIAGSAKLCLERMINV
jgi:quinolinate synthase